MGSPVNNLLNTHSDFCHSARRLYMKSSSTVTLQAFCYIDI